MNNQVQQKIKNFINETPKSQKHMSYWINKHLGYYCKEIDFMIVFSKHSKGQNRIHNHYQWQPGILQTSYSIN